MNTHAKFLIMTLALLAPATALSAGPQSAGEQDKGAVSTLPQTLPSSVQTTEPGLSSPSTGSEVSGRQAEYERLKQELASLQEGLEEKKKELAKIRRKWLSVKGRTPTRDELKEFEEKRKKGKTSVKDNPYINRSALSTPGRYREAYYKKLDEIKHDEAQIDEVKARIKDLNM